MLIDMHAHTSGVSHCCVLPPEEIVKIAKETGLDGIVLTNHYAKEYVTVEKYIQEYEITKEAGEKIGLKVWFGIEVTVTWDPRIHLLVYGVTTDFLKEHPALYELQHAGQHQGEGKGSHLRNQLSMGHIQFIAAFCPAQSGSPPCITFG